MSKKKDIVKDALLTARDLEIAAKSNAQDVVIEAFTPRLTDVIRQTLAEEGPGPQLDDPVTDLAKGEEEETESSEVQNDGQVSDGHPESITPDAGENELRGKGKKHKLDRPAPAPGQMTEEEDEDMDLDMVDEDEDMDLDDLDDEMEEGYGKKKKMKEDDGRDVGKQPGYTPRDGGVDHDETKLDESDDMEDEMDMDDDDELELEMDDLEDDGEMDSVDPEDDVFEADEDGEDEELEIPDELFDDVDDQDVEGAEDMDEEPMDDEEPEMEEDEELDLDVVDDEADMDMDDMGDEDMMEDGLYVRKEGEFQKVDPADALESRINDLEEEREKLANAVGTLRGQLGEVNLFNAKMSHLVKLYESGWFSTREKRRIAERLDRCSSIKQVKAVYKNIVGEAQDRTVLDDIHDTITESRVRRSSKPTGEAVYESDEVRRMRRIAGIE